ncbi:odorant receptor 49b-like [Microplitis demolitor]|uniref:odorant receptor 49b-like n=1 Tax=Microplitis demolitor TaxID=69319 RepID=UPI0004CD97B9|nr:odorant receptor 49b-like [Microplitis demolitor]
MDFWRNSDWRFLRFQLCTLGVWPFQKSILQKAIGFFVILSVQSITLPEVIKFTYIWRDMEEFADCFPLIGIHCVCTVKWMCCVVNMDKIIALLNVIKSDNLSAELTEDEHQILRDTGRLNRLFVLAYSIWIYVIAILFLVFVPLIPSTMDFFMPLNESRPKIVIYHTEYLFDSVEYSWVILLHQCIISPFPTIIIIATGSLYCNCCQHACGMFEVIGYRLKNLDMTIKETMNEKNLGYRTNNEIFFKSLRTCEQMHQKMLQYVEKFQDIYSVTLCFSMTISIITLCITGLQAIIKKDEFFEVIRYVTCGLAEIADVFILCWYGQKLIDSSDYLYFCACQTNWYKYSAKSQKMLISMIVKLSTPCSITLGKLYRVSLECFSTIMKTTMSYFTVINSLREE